MVMGKLIPIEQKMVNFNGAELMAVKCNDGKIYAGIKWICQGLLFDKSRTDAQVQKIQSDIVLSKGACKINLPTSGGHQEALCIKIDFLPLWLAKINANIINDQGVQDRLIQYQLKAKDVLVEAFIDQKFRLPQTYAEALRQIADIWEQNQTLLPKAESYDRFIDGKNAQTISAVAKILGTGQKKLFQFLRDKKVLMANNLPYQQHIDTGRFIIVEKPVNLGDKSFNHSQTMVTAKGVDFIAKLLDDKLRAV